MKWIWDKIGAWGTRGRLPETRLAGFSLTWAHPKLPKTAAIRLDNPRLASKLAETFEDYDKPHEGGPYDCPMYDLIVSLHEKAGRTVDIKVYLPRLRLFPGMWKHPGGSLFYFDLEKAHPKTLVKIIGSYIPDSPVYPRGMKEWPAVSFNKGMPDFREANCQISGDFSPGDFKIGRKS